MKLSAAPLGVNRSTPVGPLMLTVYMSPVVWSTAICRVFREAFPKLPLGAWLVANGWGAVNFDSSVVTKMRTFTGCRLVRFGPF